MHRLFHGVLEETLHDIVDNRCFFDGSIFNHTSTSPISLGGF